MKTLTVRLPVALALEIEAESRVRQVSKSDVVRDRLSQPRRAAATGSRMRDVVGDLIGCLGGDGRPADLSSRKKQHLPELIRAKKHHRR